VETEVALLESFAAQAVIAIENARVLSELRQRTDELSMRNSEFGERIEQQAATIDVLKAMSASPGDPQPVFDLILRRAFELCNAPAGGLLECDGELVHLRSFADIGGLFKPELYEAYERLFPMVPTRESIACRTILDRQIIHVRDIRSEPGVMSLLRDIGYRSQIYLPLLRDSVALGAIVLVAREPGGFTDSQITLLQTFAEQAVIAITSAETYRALQTRTTELQQSLEYQTATNDVLKVISRSGFDLDPVFQVVVHTATRLCRADQATIYRPRNGAYRWAASCSNTPEYERIERGVVILPGSGTLVGRVARDGCAVEIPDAWTDPLYEAKDDARAGGIHTLLGVPLMRDGEAIGVIGLARRRIEPYTKAQIELVSTFANQAVIAIENTRLLTEQQEALEQQTATAEVLQVINANPGNLAPVFDAMLQRATHLCQSSFGTFTIYDGRAFLNVAFRGVPPTLAELLRAPIQPLPGMTFGRVVEGEHVIQVADLKDDEVYRSGNWARRALVDLGGARTQLLIALRKDNTLLGAINIFRQEVRLFSDKQVALLKNFAAQAVIAMENARLITEQREALEQQTATAEVLQVINTNPGNLEPVFEALLEKALRLCEAAFGCLWRHDNPTFSPIATRGLLVDTKLFESWVPEPESFMGQVAQGADVIHVADVADTDLYRQGSPIRVHLVDAMGARTVLWVALRKDTALLGLFVIYRREVRPFNDKQIALLQNFAAQAVIAMENARLLGEIRQRQEELRITFENMGDGVALFDETPRLVAWNTKFQEILDVPDGILSERKTYEDYIRYLTERGEFGPNAEPEAQIRRLQARVGQSTVNERTRPNGRVIEVRHNPVPGGGFVLIYTDITERKRNEAELRTARDSAEEASRAIETAYRDLKAAQANLIQAAKMASLGQLTAGIAHEIKNPLNFVNNFASLSVELLAELKGTAAPGFAALPEDRRADVEDVSGLLTSNLQKIVEHGKRADGSNIRTAHPATDGRLTSTRWSMRR